jgi:hypothetical protein
MNAGFAMDKSNNDNCEKSMQEHFECFETWRPEKNGVPSFIAGKTYQNILLVTIGCLEGPDDMTATGVCSVKGSKEEVKCYLGEQSIA